MSRTESQTGVILLDRLVEYSGCACFTLPVGSMEWLAEELGGVEIS